MNDKFKKDLERGMAFEEVVIEHLNNSGYNVIKNPNEKGIDLLEINGGFEVKADHYNFHKNIKNGNAYIEFEAYGKPSGIFKDEDYVLKKWIHSLSPNSFIMLHGETFKKWIEEKIEECNKNKSLTSKGFRIVSGGDGNRTKGLLVPQDKLKEQAEKIFNL